MDDQERIRQKKLIDKKRKYTPERRRAKRLKVMGFVIVFFIVLLIGRLGFILYAHGEEYERRAIAQRLTGNQNMETVINPNRGSILDRNKHALATSTSVFDVVLDIRLLVNEPEKVQDTTVAGLCELLEIPEGTLREYLKVDPETGLALIDRNYFVIAKELPRKTAMEIEDRGLKCVFLQEGTKRSYMHDTMASQVIGFIRGDDSWGLENQYEAEMAGEKGRSFKLYGEGSMTSTEIAPAREGYTLVTTLDYTIQEIAETAVQKAGEEYEPQNAAVIVMNPHTGEVLAMAQYGSTNLNDPSNPDYFTHRQIKTEWEALSAEDQLNDLYKLWSNYSITKGFEPGSIFKPIVVAAAMEEGKITAHSSFTCNGGIEVYDQRIPCWIEAYGGTHGTVNPAEIIMHSCNVGMVETMKVLGRDLFYKYRCDFGYGEKTGIDLPGEADVSSPHVMYTLNMLGPVELATSSIGQGFNNTPIQAINSICALVNGGNLMKPYLVSQIIDKNGNVIKENSPVVVRKVISKETSDFMRQAMQTVVTPEGTGKKAVIQGYSIGGKTGTAQQGPRDKNEHTVSFVAFLPTEEPEIVAIAIIDRPNGDVEGSTSAAPMLRQVLLDIIKYKNIKPSGEVSPEDNINMEKDSIVLDDFTEMSLADASRRLNDLRMDYELVGNGDVVESQMPVAGSLASPGSKIYLTLRDSGESRLVTIPDVKGMTEEQAIDYISSANLSPIIFVEQPLERKTTGEDIGEPVTYNVTDNMQDSVQEVETTGQTELSVNQVIVNQYPTPGRNNVQEGTQIKLIISAADGL